jgi:hypothetical protein
MAKKKSLASPLVHALLNPLSVGFDIGNARVSLGDNDYRSFRRYDKFDAMRDEENRQRWNNWWDKKSDGEKQLWVGGGFALVGLFAWAMITKAEHRPTL